MPGEQAIEAGRRYAQGLVDIRGRDPGGKGERTLRDYRMLVWDLGLSYEDATLVLTERGLESQPSFEDVQRWISTSRFPRGWRLAKPDCIKSVPMEVGRQAYVAACQHVRERMSPEDAARLAAREHGIKSHRWVDSAVKSLDRYASRWKITWGGLDARDSDLHRSWLFHPLNEMFWDRSGIGRSAMMAMAQACNIHRGLKGAYPVPGVPTEPIELGRGMLGRRKQTVGMAVNRLVLAGLVTRTQAATRTEGAHYSIRIPLDEEKAYLVRRCRKIYELLKGRNKYNQKILADAAQALRNAGL